MSEAVVTKGVSPSQVIYTATGDLQAVFRAIESLLVNYDPRGYGTSVDTIHMGNDGLYVARITRMHSCD